jgi:hypothetical protein
VVLEVMAELVELDRGVVVIQVSAEELSRDGHALVLSGALVLDVVRGRIDVVQLLRSGGAGRPAPRCGCSRTSACKCAAADVVGVRQSLSVAVLPEDAYPRQGLPGEVGDEKRGPRSMLSK